MKRIFAIISILALAISCTEPQNTEQEASLNELAASCTILNTTISSLQSVVTAVQSNKELDSFAVVADNSGKAASYLLTFDDGESIVLYDVPAYVTVGQSEGQYCWMINGEPAGSITGGKAPVFKVEGEGVKLSLDGGSTWTETAQVTKSIFDKVSENAGSVDFAMADGATVSIPKAAKLQIEQLCSLGN